MSIYDFEQAFGGWDKTSAAMRKAIDRWFSMYYDSTGDETADACQRIPYTVVNKLVKAVFGEYQAIAQNPTGQSLMKALDEKKRLADLHALCLPGVTFRAMTFTPMFNKHAGTTCRGVELHITDRNAYRPLETMLHMIRHFKKYPEFEMKQNGLALRLGQDILCEDYDPAQVLAKNEGELRRYCEIAEKYRLYFGRNLSNQENFRKNQEST